MIAYYPLLKHLHMLLATLSLLLFCYRWRLALTDSPALQRRWLKVLPHINDTLLLLAGIGLALLLRLSPAAHPWLLVKLLALLGYIALGLLALKGRGFRQRLLAGLGALALFGFMLGNAITKSPLSWLG